MSWEELTLAELQRQNTVDEAIFHLVNSLNPGPNLEWDIEDIGAIRDEVAALLVRKGVCTAHEFYPYLELYDPDKPWLSYLGVDVWICVDDDDFEASFHYTTDLSNANIDNPEPYEDTQFDVREIPHYDDIPPASIWTEIKGEHGRISSESSNGREAHEAIIRYAIEQHWLTEAGLKVPDEVARRGQEVDNAAHP